MARLIALKHLALNNAIWYRDASGAHYAADITAVDTTLQSWGVVKIKVVRHLDTRPLWITRKQVMSVCD